mgnify:CR=1 FL=1|jgi:hypothetical protein
MSVGGPFPQHDDAGLFPATTLRIRLPLLGPAIINVSVIAALRTVVLREADEGKRTAARASVPKRRSPEGENASKVS